MRYALVGFPTILNIEKRMCSVMVHSMVFFREKTNAVFYSKDDKFIISKGEDIHAAEVQWLSEKIGNVVIKGDDLKKFMIGDLSLASKACLIESPTSSYKMQWCWYVVAETHPLYNVSHSISIIRDKKSTDLSLFAQVDVGNEINYLLARKILKCLDA